MFFEVVLRNDDLVFVGIRENGESEEDGVDVQLCIVWFISSSG